MSDQVESDQVDEDAPPPEEISPDEVTSKPSPDAEEALVAKVIERILSSGEIEKNVQKHANRESANLRKRQDALEENTAPLLERYQGYVDEGMTPAQARRELEIDALLKGSAPESEGSPLETDTEPDNVGALSGDDAKSAASSLLERMGVIGDAKKEILEDVGRRVSFSNKSSLEDAVYDLVDRFNKRQQKMSDSQTPFSDSVADTPPTPDKLSELQAAYDKETKAVMQDGGGSGHLIEIRRKYREQGLEV